MNTVAVRERPILFSGEMVRALLDGRKTQTRRVIKHQPLEVPTDPKKLVDWLALSAGGCPFGQPGDRLWVRETFSHREYDESRIEELEPVVWYWADGKPTQGNFTRPKPSIHMPRWASRLTLELTEVRVQRVQEISDDDCYAEGVVYGGEGFDPEPQVIYREIWDTLNAKRGYSWESNPWVWCLTFTVAAPRQEGDPK